jgi:hypothetical protein
MLWTTREAVSAAQLQLGLDAWRALANPDPRALAAIMRSDTPALPLLARPCIAICANCPLLSVASRSQRNWR